MDIADITILVVEDEENDIELIRRAFQSHGAGIDIHVAHSLREYRQKAAAVKPDIALVDLNLPDGKAFELLVNEANNESYPFVVMTGQGSEQIAVDVVKSGALDYVVKSSESFAAMPRTVTRVLREWTTIREHKQAVEELKASRERYHSLFENMLEGYAYCKMVFEHETPVDFIYIDVNKAFEKLTGLINVVGKKVSEMIPDVQKTNPELFAVYGRVILTGKPERIETYIPALASWFSI